jgi:amino acid permease
MNIPQAIANCIKNIIGCGILSLAFAAHGTGMATAILIMSWFGAYAAISFALLGSLCERSGAVTFSGIGEAAYGRRAAVAIDVTTLVQTACNSLALSLIIADNFSHTLASFGAPVELASRATVLIGITAFVLLPLCLLQDLSVLSYSSLLGVTAIVYTVVFMGVRYFDGTYAPGGKYWLQLDPSMRPSFPQAADNPWAVSVRTLVLCCALSTSYICHYNAPKFYEQLRHRSAARLSLVSAVSFATTASLYGCALWFGASTFGSAAQGNILQSYATHDPLATAARIGIGTSVVCTYPLLFCALRDSVAGLLQLKRSEGSSALAWRPRLALTLSLLSSVTGSALAITDVGFVNALGGSLFGTAIIYLYPAALDLAPSLRVPSAAGAKWRAWAAPVGRAFSRTTVCWAAVVGIGGGIVTVLDELDLLGEARTNGTVNRTTE